MQSDCSNLLPARPCASRKAVISLIEMPDRLAANATVVVH